MNVTQPIRNRQSLEYFKDYYRYRNCNSRNYTLIITGLNTALRINDILGLTWGNVYDFKKKRFKKHLEIQEQKTKKQNQIIINKQLRRTLENYLRSEQKRHRYPLSEKSYLFQTRKGTNKPLSRSQAFRIIKTAATESNLPEHISCHSLRKTFGYYAWKCGTAQAVLMNIFNHSSFQVTKRYLGIAQDDKDEVFLCVEL